MAEYLKPSYFKGTAGSPSVNMPQKKIAVPFPGIGKTGNEGDVRAAQIRVLSNRARNITGATNNDPRTMDPGAYSNRLIKYSQNRINNKNVKKKVNKIVKTTPSLIAPTKMDFRSL